MMGKRQAEAELFDVGNVYPLALSPRSFHGQLAQAAPRLFRDEDFAAFYADCRGRPSVPPSQLAMLTLLQQQAGCSDEEAVTRSAYDLRWAAVLRRFAGEPLCAKSTLQLFRSHLVLHDKVLEIFQRSITEAREAGLLKGGALRIAIDTKPILGRGAVEDTYNLLATGIRKLCGALARAAGKKPDLWARAHDLRRYFDGSIKGSVEINWSDPAAKNQFLSEIVTDARRLLRLTGARLANLSTAAGQPVREAAELLEQLLLQDVVEKKTPSGGVSAEIRDGHEKGRLPSAADPDVRHGRKSSSKRFDGHKASVAVEVESGIIVGVEVLAGDAPDATDLLAQVEAVETNTGEPVAQTLGDCAYGSGETRQTFAEAGKELIAKVPQEARRNDLFPKSAFTLEWRGGTVVKVGCPGQEVTSQFIALKEGGRLFQFSGLCRGCSLRDRCTLSLGGRTVRVHPQEALLTAARKFQETKEGRTVLRERVGVENALARLGGLGIGQARYCGRVKTRFQLLMVATVANLRRTWNWSRGAGVVIPKSGDRCKSTLTLPSPSGGGFSSPATGNEISGTGHGAGPDATLGSPMGVQSAVSALASRLARLLQPGPWDRTLAGATPR